MEDTLMLLIADKECIQTLGVVHQGVPTVMDTVGEFFFNDAITVLVSAGPQNVRCVYVCKGNAY
jgi:hypothetical protein